MRNKLSSRLSILWTSAVATGILLGLAGLAFAYLLRLAIPGRLLPDPLPLALMPAGAMSSLRGGFTYFDLRSPILHLLFAISIGAGAAWLIVRQGGTAEQARQTARIASGLSILVIAVQEVDAVIVAFYYGISAFVSLSISAFVADRVSRRLLRREATALNQR